MRVKQSYAVKEAKRKNAEIESKIQSLVLKRREYEQTIEEHENAQHFAQVRSLVGTYKQTIDPSEEAFYYFVSDDSKNRMLTVCCVTMFPDMVDISMNIFTVEYDDCDYYLKMQKSSARVFNRKKSEAFSLWDKCLHIKRSVLIEKK